MYIAEKYNSSYEGNMCIMASMRLTYSCLKSIDMLMFTVCVVTCTQTSNIEVFDPQE
jgi:hypothetical protein